MADENDGKISIIEALRLKHHFNRKVTYGPSGLNAREAKDLLDGKLDWKRIWKEYNDYYVKKLGSVFMRPLAGWSTFAVGLSLFIWGSGNWRNVGLAIFAWLLYQGAKADGHRDGYFAGYSDGHTRTTQSMLGISDEEVKEISERAIEMEIDEGTLSRFNESEKAQGD
jgi:hypothetical protein